MPSAAPGVVTRWAVRRNIPDFRTAPVLYTRRPVDCPFRWAMETCLPPFGIRYFISNAFTQLLSGIGVEKGRLGKVVSLVGDCRPPPPGNPHRPPSLRKTKGWPAASHAGRACKQRRCARFSGMMRRIGGIIFPLWMHYSFNRQTLASNLKILNSPEYFKNNRSYYYCTENQPVLEFGIFHSHMCGFQGTELPPIAITNVLGLQE